jgi:hypothetical protein
MEFEERSMECSRAAENWRHDGRFSKEGDENPER